MKELDGFGLYSFDIITNSATGKRERFVLTGDCFLDGGNDAYRAKLFRIEKLNGEIEYADMFEVKALEEQYNFFAGDSTFCYLHRVCLYRGKDGKESPHDKLVGLVDVYLHFCYEEYPF